MIACINPKYSELNGFIKAIPYIFSSSGETIQSGRNIIKTFKVNGLVINVKSFKVPILPNRIIYKYFRKSKAQRSYQYAQLLQDKGVNTPEPIAYIEISKRGLFTESYYISIHEPVDGTMKDIYGQSDEENKKLIKSFTDYTACLHEKGVFHKDYSPGNILYKNIGNSYEFYLVDLNRIKFRKINLFDSCKSFARIKINKSTREFIATEYALKRNYSQRLCIKLIGYYNRAFWKRHLQRHPENMLNYRINQYEK